MLACGGLERGRGLFTGCSLPAQEVPEERREGAGGASRVRGRVWGPRVPTTHAQLSPGAHDSHRTRSPSRHCPPNGAAAQQLGRMNAGARGLLMPREGLQTPWEPGPSSGPRDRAETQAGACQSCVRKVSPVILTANRKSASIQVSPVFTMTTGVAGGVSGLSSSVPSSRHCKGRR